MDNLKELMNRPYSLRISNSSVDVIELGIKVNRGPDIEESLRVIDLKKEEYFKNMIEHDATHLIPLPLAWRQGFFITKNLKLREWIAKCGIASLFFVASILICVSFVRKSMNRTIEKLDEVLNPVVQDETKKVEVLKKNLEKYRPYIREIVRVTEEEKKGR